MHYTARQRSAHNRATSCMVALCTHLVETRHRLISTANLDLKESGLVSITALLRTLDGGLVGIVPGAGATEHVFSLFARELSPAEHGCRYQVLIGTGSAFEAIAPALGAGTDSQDIRTMGADCSYWLVGQMCMLRTEESLTEEHCEQLGGLLAFRDKNERAEVPRRTTNEAFRIAIRD